MQLEDRGGSVRTKPELCLCLVSSFGSFSGENGEDAWLHPYLHHSDNGHGKLGPGELFPGAGATQSPGAPTGDPGQAAAGEDCTASA